MPVSFRIIPERDLVVVTYSGYVTIQENVIAVEKYVADPGFRPDQKILIDSARVTGNEQNFVEFFKMQSKMAGIFAQTGHDQLVGCYTPNKSSRDMARLVQRGWEMVDRLVMFIHEDEAEVLKFLGQPESRIEELFAADDA